MVRLQKCLWMIVAIAALPPPAAAADVCTALQRIVASAREPVPFDSVRRSAAAGEIPVPGFAPEDCRVSGVELSCGHREMGLATFDDWPDPLVCPGFVATRPTERPGWRQDRTSAYTAAGLRIEYGTRCAMCAGPASAYFRVRPEPGRVAE